MRIHTDFYVRARGNDTHRYNADSFDWYHFPAHTLREVCCPRMSRQLDGVHFSLDNGWRGTPLVCSLFPEASSRRGERNKISNVICESASVNASL